MNILTKLAEASDDDALDIGRAWNLLDEAAAEIERLNTALSVIADGKAEIDVRKFARMCMLTPNALLTPNAQAQPPACRRQDGRLERVVVPHGDDGGA